uniref:Uncharacterized protein n=1 Tax=Anguilla anguilla TaxID=7936 RepID=A0A0E9Q5A7_ANGAN
MCTLLHKSLKGLFMNHIIIVYFRIFDFPHILTNLYIKSSCAETALLQSSKYRMRSSA